MLLNSINIELWRENKMKLSILLVGIVLIICGLIGFVYAVITDVQLNATIGWVLGIILIIIGAYLAGKELKAKSK